MFSQNMKTFFLRLSTLTALVLIAAACGPEEKPAPNTGSSTKNEVKITSASAFTVPADGGTATVQFTASGKWTAALSNDRAASWLTLSATSGEKGSVSITLTAAKNEDTDDRSATIRISCGKESASVTLTQKQKDAITNTPSKTQFGAEGGSFTIEVKANIDYSFEIDSDWIHQADTKTLTTRTTTFTVDKNEDTRKREGSVTVKSSLGSEKITVYQEAAAPSIILSSESVSVKTEGGTFTVDVNTNVDVAMAITAGAEWLAEVTTKAMSTHSYSFQAAPNESNDTREGKISFKNEANGVEATVTVTQMQKDAIVVAQPLYEIGAAGGVVSIEAATNVELDVQVSEPWVHRVTTKAMQTVSYDFDVEPNTSYDVRECTVTFSGGETVSVFSQPSPWSVIGTMGGDSWTKDIEMKTDGKWHVAYGVTFTASDEFKFRKNNSWTENLGATTYSVTTIPANSPVSLMQDGGNMKIASGTYDIYLSPDSRTAYFLPAGTPFTYDGYGSPSGGLSQTVTIRQDGADGFLADFQDKYTLSALSQTLVLRSRSSVDIAAQSHADWISVVSTKALSDRSVTLQIAENTTNAARTGKVTVSAPALGASEEVTIVQMSSGDIYIPDDTFRTLLLSEFDTDGNGALSKEECKKVRNIDLNARENPAVQKIASLQGIEYFENLTALSFCEMTTDGAMGMLSGTVNLSANRNLWNIYIDGCDKMDVLDISTCTNLRSLVVYCANNLREIYFPDKEGLYLQQLCLTDSKVGPELDLSIYPDILYLYLRNNPELKKIWLTTGLEPQSALDSWCSVGYKGENVYGEVQFKDPVFKEVMLKNYDSDGDGKLTQREMEKLQYLNLLSNFFDGIDDDKVITSLEDLAMLKNIEDLYVYDSYGRVAAPLPDCLGELSKLNRICFINSDVTGTIPESVCKMDKLKDLIFDNTQITGPLPDGIGRIPNLEQLYLNNCYKLDGPIPQSLLSGCTYEYISLNGCNFDDTYVVVPSSRLLDHTTEDNNFSYLGSQTREYTLPGGGTYWEYPSIYYRSEADGHGPVHADGEVELYNAATKGPGIDFFITGDGFTAENNTVGGTMETYLKHVAEVTLSMEPYNKLKEYFNVWIIYAHSAREGTGINTGEGLKFGSYQPNPAGSSTCTGNHDYIRSFVQEATGRYVQNGTVAVIMNSSHYGGTCYWNYGTIYDNGLAVGYTPAAWQMDLTYVHETLGHGFAHLDDEYEASGQSGNYFYMGTYWPSSGYGANLDETEDVRWSPFITDSRYGTEKTGAYATQKRMSTGIFGPNYKTYYRPTVNSVMNVQWNEGGDRFNAPSREAIWQRVYLLSHPEENWTSWEAYVNNGYNREEFVQFDLAPAPSSARARAPRVMRNPERTLPDGRKVGGLPPHTPPVILNLPERN